MTQSELDDQQELDARIADVAYRLTAMEALIDWCDAEGKDSAGERGRVPMLVQALDQIRHQREALDQGESVR